MLSEHRDLAAAKAFFHLPRTVTGVVPDRVTIDVPARPDAMAPTPAKRLS
jgi:hypothetical protein